MIGGVEVDGEVGGVVGRVLDGKVDGDVGGEGGLVVGRVGGAGGGGRRRRRGRRASGGRRRPGGGHRVRLIGRARLRNRSRNAHRRGRDTHGRVLGRRNLLARRFARPR